MHPRRYPCTASRPPRWYVSKCPPHRRSRSCTRCCRCTWPCACSCRSQLSFVHGSLSLQVRVVFTQPVVGSCRVFDGSHPSSVQALLSLHAASLRPCWQPFTASQVSVVHEKPSSQAPLLGECWQPWAVQVSVVQATPSSQAPLLGECWQPWAVQVSVVQATPSSQAPLLGECWQPLTTSPVSVVQATPSSQAPLLGEG